MTGIPIRLRRIMRFSCLLLVAAVVLAVPATSLEPWRMVVRVQGKVESRRADVESWSPIFRSRVLADGDYARTLADSRALIKLADQSQFAVGANTTVEMTRFSLTPQGRLVVFNLQVGKIKAYVSKVFGSESRFEVKTPNGVLAARGTEFYVEYQPPATPAPGGGPAPSQGQTFLIVFNGVVEVISVQGHRWFHAGEFGTIDAGGVHFRPGYFPPFVQGPTPLEGDLLQATGGPGGGDGQPPVLQNRPPVDFMVPLTQQGSGSLQNGAPMLPPDVIQRILESTGHGGTSNPGGGSTGGSTGTTGTLQIQIR